MDSFCCNLLLRLPSPLPPASKTFELTCFPHFQPEDRPLRIKRSRKSNAAGEQGEEGGQNPDNAAEPADRDPAALPRLAPAPSQQDLTSSFRVQGGGNGAEGDHTPAAASTHSQDNREEQSEQPAEGADSGTTPMDMDTKEPKEEQ